MYKEVTGIEKGKCYIKQGSIHVEIIKILDIFHCKSMVTLERKCLLKGDTDVTVSRVVKQIWSTNDLERAIYYEIPLDTYNTFEALGVLLYA